MLKEIAPLIADLQVILGSIRPAVARIVTTGFYIEYPPSIWAAFNRVAEVGGAQLLAGRYVLPLLRGLLAGNVNLPVDAVLISADTEGGSARLYAAQQFFTITTVSGNRLQRLIDPCQTGIEDIQQSRLRTVTPNPLEQIKQTPECLIEAIMHIRAGFVPVENLEKAMREWVPDESYQQQYGRVLTFMKTQFSTLTLAERIAQINILVNYGLMQKLFGIKCEEPQKALWLLKCKWLPSLSFSKFHLLSGASIKQGSKDDMDLAPVKRISISCLH